MMEMDATLPFGSPVHQRLVEKLRQLRRVSENKISERYDKWKKAEELYLAYLPKSAEDTKRANARDLSGVQTYETITVPYSYATLLTAHTYWSAVFLGRNPVNQYTARHGEGHQSVQAIEALMDYQVQVGQMLVPYYVWLLDAGKYGVGVVSNHWAEDRVTTSRFVEEEKSFLGISIPGTRTKRRVVEQQVAYAGNKICNVRPYDFLPDPRVSLANFQHGEFCGHMAYPTWNDILRGEYINKDRVKELRSRAADREYGSSQVNLPDIDVTSYATSGRFADRPDTVSCFEVTWEIIPAEWGLEGGGNSLEKWVFVLAQNEVIVKARPLGAYHNQFPYAVLSYEVDGYSHQSRGMMEILKPLNDTLNWLINSHFYNVRKILNDQMVVDPSKIVLKDLLDGGPGKIIRATPAAYGTDIRNALFQLPIQDITRANIADMQVVMEVMQRVSGVTDNLMGLTNPGGRTTATEVRTSSNFGINRLKTVAEYMSAMGFAPLSQMMLQNTQQYYDMGKKFKIAGDLLLHNPEAFMMVTPDMIAGFYDFVPADGTLPVDRFAQANLWKEVLMGMNQMPMIAMQYDLGGIFQWMAQLAGLKNITQFKIQVAPDEQVMNAAATGRMVPAGGPAGAGPGAVPGNNATSAAGLGIPSLQ